MFNRWVRFLIAVGAIAAAAFAAYRAVEHEQQLARDTAAASTAQIAAETTLVTLSDLRGALHAYLVDGQSPVFWTTRANMLFDKLRASLLQIESAASTAGLSMKESLEGVDRLAAVDQRAREHLKADQRVLAGEAIFTEMRDLADTVRLQIVRARTEIALASGRRVVELRRQQMWLLGGAGGLLALIMLLLVPVPGREVIVRTVETPARPPFDDLDEFPLPKAKPSGLRPVAPTAPAAIRADSPRPAPMSAAAASASSRTEAVSPKLALLCTDLARVADSGELNSLLTRALDVLDATGIVLWLASSEGRELLPVASAGYEPRVANRFRAIPREGHNLTTDAFRDGRSRTSARGQGSPAALAVPLPTPTGTVGVLSAELKGDADVTDSRIATAEIVAAQLAVIVGAKSANSDVA